MDRQAEIKVELEHAEQARQRGNEGQARVCARRAAGIAVHEYFERHGQRMRTPGAYDSLRLIVEDTSLPPDLHQSAVYLTLRVNEEFKLPVDIDLITEARKFCQKLLTT